MQRTKFQSVFEKEPYIVIQQKGLTFKVQRLSDNATAWRHINDLKLFRGIPANIEAPYQLERRWSPPLTPADQPPATNSSSNTDRIPPLRLTRNNGSWAHNTSHQQGRPQRVIQRPARLNDYQTSL
eukprot:gene6736-7494_t